VGEGRQERQVLAGQLPAWESAMTPGAFGKFFFFFVFLFFFFVFFFFFPGGGEGGGGGGVKTYGTATNYEHIAAT